MLGRAGRDGEHSQAAVLELLQPQLVHVRLRPVQMKKRMTINAGGGGFSLVAQIHACFEVSTIRAFEISATKLAWILFRNAVSFSTTSFVIYVSDAHLREGMRRDRNKPSPHCVAVTSSTPLTHSAMGWGMPLCVVMVDNFVPNVGPLKKHLFFFHPRVDRPVILPFFFIHA